VRFSVDHRFTIECRHAGHVRVGGTVGKRCLFIERCAEFMPFTASRSKESPPPPASIW